MKHTNLYLGLVLPSGGWQSLIDCGQYYKTIIMIVIYETSL